MTKRKLIRLNRKWHRYLGLLLGVQFLLWTLGGLYFSWTNIDEIRGDNLKAQDPFIAIKDTLVSPSTLAVKDEIMFGKIKSLETFMLLGKPSYRVICQKGETVSSYLFDALNGKQIQPLNKEESIAVAKTKLNVAASIGQVDYLTETNQHHEYRGRPLPAFAINFKNPANTTVYVSTTYGNVQTFRNGSWRVFDFFWMLHTMDYNKRDNFNNLLLRIFALFGLITILSGFTLFIFTSKSIRKK